jgi:hypothetical protein
VRPKECQRFILSHLLPDRRNAWLTLTHGRIGNRVNKLLTSLLLARPDANEDVGYEFDSRVVGSIGCGFFDRAGCREQFFRSCCAVLGRDRLQARGFRRATGSNLSPSLSSLCARRRDFPEILPGTFSDAYDETGNVYLFGLYIDDELASSIRIHVASKEHPDFPGLEVFPDFLQPELDAGKVMIDSTRFVTDENLARLPSRIAICDTPA